MGTGAGYLPIPDTQIKQCLDRVPSYKKNRKIFICNFNTYFIQNFMLITNLTSEIDF